MALKNKYSEGKGTFEKITKILTDHRARQISYGYDKDGRVTELAFSLELDGKLVSFRLPARVGNVERIFLEEKKRKNRSSWGVTLSQTDKDQAYKTAWANIRDWLDAQMALVDTEMVKVEEVFLPYVQVSPTQTLFEHYQSRRFELPERTTSEEGEIIS